MTAATQVTVVTLANAGRLVHVARQAACLPRDVRHLVVALGDAVALAGALPDSEVIPLGEFSLAGARNLGGDLAAKDSEGIIIFLDADCLPGAGLIDSYRLALDAHPEAVVSGPVTYLPDGDRRITRPDPHPARPNPRVGTLLPADDHDYELFWSLSFALTADTWRRIRRSFGGFDKGYTGYGAEDTDFGQHLRAHRIPLFWVGGADAYHQWHPVSDPPWEHFHDILRNAERFHGIWGFWPMSGWLEKFADEGAVEFRDGRWVAVSSRQARVQTRSGRAPLAGRPVV
ncbi:glycosyltransferase family 2 protein [Corynebacterium sp.]|uniref:glycosyltransferase family 2 protein n=1 Tax=Corynebacterium sp. TaxID=1720 RepID=UPI0026E08342|nr:galactosyltransferase-related protein [Corynebacterium sp.]MDO5513155.1 glycosyltransferase family 2 protein [Corynebacterium sp.]